MVAAIAVVMVSYMILWMRRHSRGLKTDLERVAGSALAQGSAFALVAMAFLAVLREGLETAVFLLAAFQSSGSAVLASIGALLGIAVAVVLGWLIYRGGLRLNLSRFFRITGAVLVLVAAGLVAKTLRAAYEAGWMTIGQQHPLDLTAIARPGSVQASLLTGVLGHHRAAGADRDPRLPALRGADDGWWCSGRPSGAVPPGHRPAADRRRRRGRDHRGGLRAHRAVGPDRRAGRPCR